MYMILKKSLLAISFIALSILSIACGDEENDDNDHNHSTDIHGLELLDRDDGDAVIAEVHDDHWDGAPLTLEVSAERSFGFRFLDDDDEEVDIPLGTDDYELVISADDDNLVDIHIHGDHADLEGLVAGDTELHIEVLHDGDDFFHAPHLSVLVTDE